MLRTPGWQVVRSSGTRQCTRNRVAARVARRRMDLPQSLHTSFERPSARVSRVLRGLTRVQVRRIMTTCVILDDATNPRTAVNDRRAV